MIWASSWDCGTFRPPYTHSSNAHAQPSTGARCRIFGRTLCLLPYFMCASSEGSGETARMRRLAGAFAGRLCGKYHNLMSWLIWSFTISWRTNSRYGALDHSYRSHLYKLFWQKSQLLHWTIFTRKISKIAATTRHHNVIKYRSFTKFEDGTFLTHDLKLNVGHCDLYFTVHWFCLKSWRLFDVCASVRPDVWPKNKCRSLWPIVMVQWLCLIPWRLFHVWASLFGIMNRYDPTHYLKLNVGHRDLYFTVYWFRLISWRLFDVCTSYFRSMNQHDPTFDLKINIGHCDLYFMVQWLCLLPWRLLHVGTSLFGIMNQYDPTHDLIINVGHRDIYFMVQWFYVISWRLFDVWTSCLGIMGQYDRTFDL